MATTALFAEILVIGLLAIPWVAIAAITATRTSLSGIPDLHGWDAPLLAVGIAFAYALGIMVDRLGDWLFESWDERISQAARSSAGLGQDELPERPEVRFRLMDKAPPLAMEFLDYARSRRRILRGVAVNGSVTALVGIANLLTGWAIGTQLLPRAGLVTLAVGAIALTAGSLISWWHVGDMYYRRSLVAFRLFCMGDSGGGTSR